MNCNDIEFWYDDLGSKVMQMHFKSIKRPTSRREWHDKFIPKDIYENGRKTKRIDLKIRSQIEYQSNLQTCQNNCPLVNQYRPGQIDQAIGSFFGCLRKATGRVNFSGGKLITTALLNLSQYCVVKFHNSGDLK